MDSDSDAYMSYAASESEDDFMDSEDERPMKPPAKKKPAGGASKAVLAPKENLMHQSSKATNSKAVAVKGKTTKKTVEQIYQKKTQLEHILLRPDTYSESLNYRSFGDTRLTYS